MNDSVNIRELVLDGLLEFEREEAKLSEILHTVLENYQYLSKRERALYTRILEGSVERMLTLDSMLNLVSKTPMHKCKPLIRNLLRLSVYQLYYMDRMPESMVCNEAVKLAKKRGFSGLSGFVNGVLRSFIRKQKEGKVLLVPPDASPNYERSIRYSVPEWLVARLLSWYCPETVDAILEAQFEPKGLTARINGVSGSLEEIVEQCAREGIRVTKGQYADCALRLNDINYVRRIEAFRQGMLTIQDESSILQGFLIPKGFSGNVLDLCAAPGGKSMHAAERIGAGYCVEARDLSEAKVELIRDNVERMQYKNIKTKVWDATVWDPSCEDAYDLVICDLPCSGIGVMGRKSDIKYRLQESQLAELVLLQRNILANAVRYVKPGGYLLYSTCTLNPEENRQQVRYIADAYEYVPVSLERLLPEGLCRQVENQEETDLSGGYVSLIPGLQSCDGFFMALLQRKKETR